MLKTPSFLTEGFKDINKAQEKIFKNVCDFVACIAWRSKRIASRYYINVDTIECQEHLLNPIPLECITGYIMEDAVGDRNLNNMPKIRMN